MQRMSHSLNPYNVVWTTPSKDVSGSMPIGNGDIGANVWVEESGDIFLLVSKTDSWDENSTNLKLARVRLSLKPNPLENGGTFKQALHLGHGNIFIWLGPEGSLRGFRIWMDANQPVIHIEALGSKCELTAKVEMWRTEPRTIKTQTGDLFRDLSGKDPFPTIVSPDVVLDAPDRVVWCHHNEPREQDGYAINLKLQGLGEMPDRMPHPLRGSDLRGRDGLRGNDPPGRDHSNLMVRGDFTDSISTR